MREVAFVANALEGTVSVIDVKAAARVKTINVMPDGRVVSFLRDPLQWLAQPIAQSEGGLTFAKDTDISRDRTVL